MQDHHPINRGDALLEVLNGFDDECVGLLEALQQEREFIAFSNRSGVRNA